jgi:TrpR-related protein YerC/YecD
MEEYREKNGKINWETKKNQQLLESFLVLNSKDEAKRFLRDLMTEGEIKEFANRLESARLLTKSVQYCEIIEKTGLSSTTIARISKWLKGPLGGYRLVLNKMHHTHSQNNTGKGLSLHS